MEKFGIARDGSYYTRIRWSSHTETDPMLWVCNILTDDHERDGGTWGSNTFGPVELVLDFFGETQTVSRVDFYRLVGASISVIGELAKTVDIWYCADDSPEKLRTAKDDINSANWVKLKRVAIERDWGWQQVMLDAPVEAKYMRFTLVENDHETIDWTEMNQIKIF